MTLYPSYSSLGGDYKPLKVMIFSLEYGPKISGGVGTHVQELARGLGRAGCQVTVLAYSPAEQKIVSESNVTIHHVLAASKSGAGKAGLSMTGGILSLNNDLAAYAQTLLGEGEKPDIIQYHNWITFGAASRCARDFGIPLTGTIHFLSEPMERFWGQTPDAEIVDRERALFSQPHTMIAVSRSIRDIIRETYKVPGDLIHVVHNGMDAGAFIKARADSEEMRRLREGLAKPDDKIVIFAGRLNPMKGVTALLTSACRVLEDDPSVRYLLIGEADSRNYTRAIEDIFRQHPQLRKRVMLLGKLKRQQLALLYQIADLAVVPSVYEPFGYSAIEAMAAGLPVIGTDVGGLKEIIENEVTGLLVPVYRAEDGLSSADAEQLYAAQLRLLRDETLAKQFGEAGRQRVHEKFGSERMARETTEVYRQAISIAGSAI